MFTDSFQYNTPDTSGLVTTPMLQRRQYITEAEHVEQQSAVQSILFVRDSEDSNDSSYQRSPAQLQQRNIQQRLIDPIAQDIPSLYKCDTCNQPFQNTILLDKEFMIDLNRAIQCMCQCNICKICYNDNKGCVRHKLVSQRGPINSTMVSLLDNLDVQQDSTDITDPVDTGPLHHDAQDLVAETIAAITGPEMNLPQGNFKLHNVDFF